MQNANAVCFVGKRRRRGPKRRFFAGKPSKCAEHRRCGTRKNVIPLVSSAHWMKRHVSGRPHDVRTRPLSLILADAKNSLLGQFFLYPTKAELLREPYGPYRAHAKRQRSVFCGKEEASGSKAKVFRRKTEQMRRTPTMRHSEKCYSTRIIRALDETSRFRATTRRQNTTFIAHFGRCQKFAFRSVLPLSHKSRAFVGALRMSVSKYGFHRAE